MSFTSLLAPSSVVEELKFCSPKSRVSNSLDSNFEEVCPENWLVCRKRQIDISYPKKTPHVAFDL